MPKSKEKMPYAGRVFPEGSVRTTLAMATQDPLVKAVKKAYRESNLKEVDDLLTARRKWQRRATIALNKLDQIDSDIRDLTVRQALILDGSKQQPQPVAQKIESDRHAI